MFIISVEKSVRKVVKKLANRLIPGLIIQRDFWETFSCGQFYGSEFYNDVCLHCNAFAVKHNKNNIFLGEK